MNERVRFKSIVCSIALVGMSALPTWAQAVTNIISGPTVSNYPGAFYVGASWLESDSYLEINTGGQLISGSGIIGYGNQNQGCAVLVKDAGSIWSNTAGIYVGEYGASNQVKVANTGAIYSIGTYIGYGGPGNTGIVTGAGSLWINYTDNDSAYIGGWNSANNELRIEDGGRFEDYCGTIGNDSACVSNRIIVNGNVSLWTNRLNASIGNQGSFNSLVLTNGGHAVVPFACYVGGSVSGSNTVTVTGNGSVLTVGNYLEIGQNGGLWGNRVVISDGGQVVCAGSCAVSVETGCYVSNTVRRIAGGLDMSSGSYFNSQGSYTLRGGTINIAFAADPVQTGRSWGLRWAGNHVTELQGYANANPATLTWSDSGLSPYWQKRVSVYYDSTSDCTYVGFNVTHIPVTGTVITFH